MNPLLPTIAAIVIAAPALALADAPPIFTKKTFDEAMKQATTEGKLLVADSTADWCPPCKQMDKVTWVDAKVIEWFKANAIALQFDVDKDPKRAEALRIEAMPTMVVYKDGKEIDRSTGFMTADQLVTWLTDVKQGKTKAAAREETIKKLREKAGNRAGPDGKIDIRAILNTARELSRSEPELAAAEFEWLWDNMLEHQPSMVGVRVSFMAGDMQRLAASNVPAKERFKKLRNATEETLRAKTDPELRGDWIALNRVVGDEDRTLAWYDRVKDDRKSAPEIERNAYSLNQLFRARARWRDLGLLTRQPEQEARRSLTINDHVPANMPKEHADSFRKMTEDRARTDVIQLYVGLLAAQRDKDAASVADLLLKQFDDAATRRAMVTTALEANQPREAHFKLLDESAAKEPGTSVDDLRTLLTAALAKAQSK